MSKADDVADLTTPSSVHSTLRLDVDGASVPSDGYKIIEYPKSSSATIPYGAGMGGAPSSTLGIDVFPNNGTGFTTTRLGRVQPEWLQTPSAVPIGAEVYTVTASGGKQLFATWTVNGLVYH